MRAQELQQQASSACAAHEAAEADLSLLDQPDEMGYYPLQWAALNNRVTIISFLIDKSVDINR